MAIVFLAALLFPGPKATLTVNMVYLGVYDEPHHDSITVAHCGLMTVQKALAPYKSCCTLQTDYRIGEPNNFRLIPVKHAKIEKYCFHIKNSKADYFPILEVVAVHHARPFRRTIVPH